MTFREVALRVVVVVVATMAVVMHNADAFAPRSTTMTTTTTTAQQHATVTARTTASSVVVFSSVATLVENLPSVDELKTAPFMKQVQYGADMTDALTALSSSTTEDSETDANTNTNNAQLSDTLRTSLSAQLSHSDGIRGFMVAYLTGSYESSTDADGSIDASEMIANEQDPPVLLETVHGLLGDSNSDELVSLMCMNVVMPIAMITMHQDPALSKASRLTAARGIRLLGSVVQVSASIEANLKALLKAATVSEEEKETSKFKSDDPLVEYWTTFFGKWGYEDPQKKDIAATMKELLSKSSQ
jgi:hypothetical protein